MTGNQPDPPRTGRGEMACRCMPAGCKNGVRPAMLRLTAIAACRPRRVAIDHFSSPFQSDGCSGNRTRPVPRRSGDDTPCSPERSCRAALRRRIPADRVQAGTDRVRCRTGRTVHRRLSHAHYCKERASVARARPDKGLTRQRGGRNGCGRREVTKLKHTARGLRWPCRGAALPDKAEQCAATFLPTGSRPFTPICRANLRDCRGENVSCALHGAGGTGAAGCPHIHRPTASLYCETGARHVCAGALRRRVTHLTTPPHTPPHHPNDRPR